MHVTPRSVTSDNLAIGNRDSPRDGGEWEGGTRTTAFVSGGVIPPALRGSTSEVPLHVVDWYAIMCNMAGVSPVDLAAIEGQHSSEGETTDAEITLPPGCRLTERREGSGGLEHHALRADAITNDTHAGSCRMRYVHVCVLRLCRASNPC